MILVTGATGHLGKATIDFLLNTVSANQIAALVRDEAKAEELAAKGVELRRGDYNDIDSLEKAFAGVDTLLLVSSASLEDRVGQHINAINAAVRAGVKHLIYTSVVKASHETKFIPGADHIKTEEYLKQSGILYTIFRNTFYAEVLPTLWGNVLESGQWFYPADAAKANFAARKDMAEALANVLVSPEKHLNKTYEITGSKSYTFAEIAEQLSDVTGKTITYTDIPLDAFKEGLTKAGVPQQYVPIIVSISEAFKAGEMDATEEDLETLLGRKPTSLSTYLQETYAH
ncbi:SDR family oxidoreductase [Runella sp.]|uniref:SDR family oxidoreductase n=1 Tax=Runella sp. TaxID=1960881 RepID=UPI003D112B40